MLALALFDELFNDLFVDDREWRRERRVRPTLVYFTEQRTIVGMMLLLLLIWRGFEQAELLIDEFEAGLLLARDPSFAYELVAELVGVELVVELDYFFDRTVLCFFVVVKITLIIFYLKTCFLRLGEGLFYNFSFSIIFSIRLYI